MKWNRGTSLLFQNFTPFRTADGATIAVHLSCEADCSSVGEFQPKLRAPGVRSDPAPDRAPRATLPLKVAGRPFTAQQFISDG